MPFKSKHCVNKAESELRLGQHRISEKSNERSHKQASQGTVMNGLNIAPERHC